MVDPSAEDWRGCRRRSGRWTSLSAVRRSGSRASHQVRGVPGGPRGGPMGGLSEVRRGPAGS
eukprot:368632-Prorocentrum_minimum.AAC.2